MTLAGATTADRSRCIAHHRGNISCQARAPIRGSRGRWGLVHFVSGDFREIMHIGVYRTFDFEVKINVVDKLNARHVRLRVTRCYLIFHRRFE